MARLTLFAAALAAAHAQQFTLNMLANTDQTGAVCIDGTPGGFYFQPGSGSDVNNWMIYFQGGGWCYDEADCYGRSLGSLGSSKSWAKTGSMAGMLSNNPTTNPLFANWNKVWLAYCDGNSFSGNADQPVNYYGHNLYFRGHRIVDEVMAAVNANAMKGPAQWSAAQKVVLTGCSAGGLSTYLHADYVYNSFVKPLAPSASYYVIPISGFFLDSPNVLGQHVYAQQIQVIHALSNASAPGSVNDACIAANPGATWKCNMAQYTLPFIQSRIFGLNSIYDSWQTGCVLTPEPVVSNNNTAANGNCSAAPGWHDCASNPEACSNAQMGPYNAFRSLFIQDYNTTTTGQAAGNGGFFTSCHTHCEAQSDSGWTGFKIGGVAMRDAVAAWIASDPSTPAAANTYYDCQYDANGTPRNCNPSC